MHHLLDILVLAVVQGLTELLPVSSSAHVVMAGRLLGVDTGTTPFVLLLVMLHTGTMAAVVVAYWSRWRARFWPTRAVAIEQARLLVLATAATGVVGYPLVVIIEHLATRLGWAVPQGGAATIDFEQLFNNLWLIAAALATVGALIVAAGLRARATASERPVGAGDAAWMGAIQGLCLPFRGFSRSGSTISVALLRAASRAGAEEFSFAMAVLITPLAIARELWRVHKHGALHQHLGAIVGTDLLAAALSFLAGLVALRWLSRWLERGHWHWFGYYCLAAAAAVLVLARASAT